MAGDDARKLRPDGMPVGRPFVSGDARRGPGRARGVTAGGPTARSLARQGRGKNIAALEALRDGAEDERVRLDAAELLLLYSDGAPGVGNVPPESEETAAEDGQLARVLEILQQPLEHVVVDGVGRPESSLAEGAGGGATPPTPAQSGGDSGDEGQGNGGAA